VFRELDHPVPSAFIRKNCATSHGSVDTICDPSSDYDAVRSGRLSNVSRT
jgi:hypothetical protein